MKVLWTVNTLPPKIASELQVKSGHAISWVEAMSVEINELQDVSLAIASPSKVTKIVKKRINNIDYYAVPDNKENWEKIINEVDPDIIHAYGTEKAHNITVCEIAKNKPVLISLQGLLSEYQRHYYAGIDMSTILRYTTIRDIFRPSGFITGRIDFKKRAKNEINLLNMVKYVEGRSTWDKVSSKNINPKLIYYKCPRMLRKEFYESEKWTIDKITRHTIFVSQGDYPIKGIHYAFLAISKLKKKYPDIKLVVTGNDMFEKMKGWNGMFSAGYKKYLYDLAKKLDIIECISYVGKKDACGMAQLFRSVNVAIITSSIENAPNSLAEAMLVGTPCIASFVGGNMDMMEHNKEGFLYCYNEYNMLAEYIDKIFSSDELAIKFSYNSIKTANYNHDRNMLVNKLYTIYLDIIGREKNIEK